MKKKGPFEWTPEANAAFQGLKRYLTSPLVMVAPHPLEPLVLYMATTPHPASAALVAVREGRQARDLPHDPMHPVEMTQHQDDAPEATAAPADDRAPQHDAPMAAIAPTGDRAPEVP